MLSQQKFQSEKSPPTNSELRKKQLKGISSQQYEE